MKVSLNWLRDFVDCDLSSSEPEALFRRAGLEVASVEERGAAFDKVVVAQVLESAQHPNADRLSVCKRDDGSGTPRQIVCGAKNYKVGEQSAACAAGGCVARGFQNQDRQAARSRERRNDVQREGAEAGGGRRRVVDPARGRRRGLTDRGSISDGHPLRVVNHAEPSRLALPSWDCARDRGLHRPPAFVAGNSSAGNRPGGKCGSNRSR